jgi:hypothetical protein
LKPVMQCHRLYACIIVLSILCLASSGFTQPVYDIADELGIIPTPREITLTGNTQSLDGWEIVVPHDAPLAQIGAEELNQRITELGGVVLPIVHAPTPGVPGLLVGRWYDSFIHPAATALQSELTAANPGPQGYVIACGDLEGRPVIVLGGSDDQGALYACVTLRYMMQGQSANVVVRTGRVRDWPDFKIRQNGNIEISLLAQTEATPTNPGALFEVADALKAKVDYYLRHKVNWVTGGVLPSNSNWDPELYPVARRLSDEVMQYARSRGIRTRIGGNAEIRQYLTPELIQDAVGRNSGTSYMWAALDAHRAHANQYAALLKDAQPGLFVFHPIDSGGFLDPEKWSARSPQSRARYQDDRTLAEFEQFKIYFDAIRNVSPDVMLEAVSLPYHFQWTIDEFPQIYEKQNLGMPHVGWLRDIKSPDHAREVQQVLHEHHRRLGQMLDPDVFITFREASQKIFLATADLYPSNPLTIWIYPDRNFGWLGTWCPQVRMAKTFWFPERQDKYYVASSWTRFGDGRVQRMAQQEYLWNVDRPDASTEFSTFARFYEEAGRHIPAFQREHLIPRISRILYGDGADAFQQLLLANVSLNYVSDPEKVAAFPHAENLDDTYKYMEEQAAHFKRLHPLFAELVENMQRNRVTDNPQTITTDAWTLFWYKYTGIAAQKSKLENITEQCRALKAAGKSSDARSLARRALDQIPAMQQQCETIHIKFDEKQQGLQKLMLFVPPAASVYFDVLNKFRPGDFTDVLEKIL